MLWIYSTLAVAASLVAIFVEPVRPHQSSAYIGGQHGFFSNFGRSHHFPNIVSVPKTISLPKHVPVLKHVSLPLPYPVFRPHQIPMYKAVPVKMDKIVRVPVKVPKYYSVPVHKVIAVPRYFDVPVEVPIYQEVFVKRVVEVPVPVYIKRPAKHPELNHSSGGGYHQPIVKDHSGGLSHGGHEQAVGQLHGGHDAQVHAEADGQHVQLHATEVQHGQVHAPEEQHGQVHSPEVQHGQVQHGVEHGQALQEVQHAHSHQTVQGGAHYGNAGQEAKHVEEVHSTQSAQGQQAPAAGHGLQSQQVGDVHQHATAETKGHHLQQTQEVLQAQAAQKASQFAQGPYHTPNPQPLPQGAQVQRFLHAQQVQGLQQMNPHDFVHFAQPMQSWVQNAKR